MRQRGQSMAEFAAGSAALSLVLLGTLTLGSYQEVDRRGVEAAREAAWQQVWRSEVQAAELAADLHRAHFSDSGVSDPLGRHLLVAADQVAVDAQQVAPGGVAGAATTLMLAPPRAFSFFDGSFDLPEQTLHQGSVTSHIEPQAALPAPFDRLDVQLSASYALLGDPWNAAGAAHVAARAGGLVPTARLRGLQEIWRPLSAPLSLFEPALRDLCLGLIEPDRVPEDRLGPGRADLPGTCR